MNRTRALFFLITLAIAGALAVLISLYARGYRLTPGQIGLEPNGLLVIKSVPDGASVYINGELTGATNANLSLSPGTYDVGVKRDGFISWSKRLTIEKEVVTQTTVHLFKSAPSLSAITFGGVKNTVPSFDMTKIAFVVPPDLFINNANSPGLWVIEAVNLPIGFAREPRRITDGDLSDSKYIWSPDGREILLTTSNGSFQLPVGEFTPQSQRVNLTASRREETLSNWSKERAKKLTTKMNRLPEELIKIIQDNKILIVNSPDEDMILYTSTVNITIPGALIKQLPGASTQKQERDIKVGNTYIYDIKEDRNFLVFDKPVVLGGEIENETGIRLSWFATSRHLVLAEADKVIIMDYDGTNRHEVYTGSYVAPHAFPTLSTDRLLILTNLGANNSPPNLYSLSLK